MKRRSKRKTVWAYLDGQKHVDVLQAALDNNMLLSDMNEIIIKENPGRSVTLVCE